MTRHLPLERLRSTEEVEKFSAKMKRLGFTFRPIGKPEALLVEIKHTWSVNIEDLADVSRDQVDKFLKTVSADGGIVLGFEARKKSDIYVLSAIVTLLPYSLEPLARE